MPVAPRLLTSVSKPEPVSPIPDEAPVVDARYARLGARLFRDKRLSADQSVACSSCHDPAHAFAGTAPLPVGAHGTRAKLNAPSLENLVYDSMYGWYGIRTSIEKQVEIEFASPDRMGVDVSVIAKTLAASEPDAKEFAAAFPDGLTSANVVCALSDYIRTRITPGSKYDRFRRGEVALDGPSGEEVGYVLFKTWGCASCHQGRNLGGNLLAKVDLEHEKDFGAPDETDVRPELGRWLETHGPQTFDDAYVFRVPSLRNIDRTAPYFRDGSVPTLEAAVLRESARQLGHAITPTQVELITAFLKTVGSDPVEEPK